MIVCAVGVHPESELAASAGLSSEKQQFVLI
jgi:NAD(P)H-nitrite reductase large subunit